MGELCGAGGRAYLCVDLKSFYASVECAERGLDPIHTHLVVADVTRTEKTICLAVSPSLKAYGVPGRARLFEVVEKMAQVNAARRRVAPGQRLTGESSDARALKENGALAAGYITAPPRMSLYIQYSTRIYSIYMKYISPEDMHVYSIDEVFIDLTPYLSVYRKSPREMAALLMNEVYAATRITATAGIGENLYLCKVAMDIMAKHAAPDENGARIASLSEMEYRRLLWDHRPLTDFWRIGRGYAKKLSDSGLYTMGDVARCAVSPPGERRGIDFLYRLFGVNAELLIDHAWGYESCTMADIKAFKPSAASISTGQVLAEPYTSDRARLIVREMAELLALDLVRRGLLTDQVALMLGYDAENMKRDRTGTPYRGAAEADGYGRSAPQGAHGSHTLQAPTASARLITQAFAALFDRIADPRLLVRRVTLAAARVTRAEEAAAQGAGEQMDMFTDYQALEKQRAAERAALEKEKKLQRAELDIKSRFGGNALLKGMNLEEGATTVARNGQIGGHKA